MLIKEYRILLPLTAEEYRIAQLFMIQKKSRLESSGAGSGVEIIKNEPYENGPSGDSGQYTYKIYHIGNRIPTWIRNVLPSSALEAHEEAWNSYPYTKTRYSCPLISHFSVEVETKYLDDGGRSENTFNLSSEELKQRSVDVIDFVRDPISSHDYVPEEDPKLYRSERTGRGPLAENWAEECLCTGRPLMCAYKLCKVEFKYWGLQTRAERWIHELALRGTMLRAHRQAWAWQDEWFGLDIEDIRRLEDETQEYLCTLMSAPSEGGEEEKKSSEDFVASKNGLIADDTQGKSMDGEEDEEEDEEEEDRMEEYSSTSDVFFDCSDKFKEDQSSGRGGQQHKTTLVRWSSELLVNEEDLDEKSPPRTPRPSNKSLLILVFHGDLFPKTSADSKITDTNTLRSTLETLIANHYCQLKNRVHVQCVTCGSELASMAQLLNGLCSSFGPFHPSIGPILASDRATFQQAITSTIANANRAVRTSLAMGTTSAMFGGQQSSKFFDGSEAESCEIFVVGDFIGGILMYEALARTAAAAQQQQQAGHHEQAVHQQQQKPVPKSYQHSPVWGSNSHSIAPVGIGPLASSATEEEEALPSAASHQLSLSAGPIIATSAATSEGSGSAGAAHQQVFSFDNKAEAMTATKSPIRQFSDSPSLRGISREQSLTGNNNNNEQLLLSFRPKAAFLLGCPLALVLIQRKLAEADQNLSLASDQLFNLFYTLDLCAARLEPVLNPNLALLPVPKVPRYQRFHLLGDGGHDTHFDNNALLEHPMIWGNRWVDHELYCPPEMSSLPALALPSILHASYWESRDVGSFILRQFLRFDEHPCPILTLKNLSDQPPLQFQMPLTVWNRRRTRFKVANLAANHRANDVIVVEGEQLLLSARFCYGPMDLVVLSQENVLVYLLPSGGEWFLRGVETTDKHGRLAIDMSKDSLPVGISHVRLIVQGDHTFLSVSIAVVPQGTPLVVFSIDGSLTASVSVTGRDPRLRPGAVDVVRFWQQQGYLIIYLTARLDMQQRLVSAWLATHNFPHGLLFFMPSLSTDPLRQKQQFVKHLADIGLSIQAAYGSAKDVPVYANAGLDPERIFTVGASNRRRHHHQQNARCVPLDNGYSTHLHDLHAGRIEIAQPAAYIHPFSASPSPSPHGAGSNNDEQQMGVEQQQQKSAGGGQWSGPNAAPPIQRTLSFGPRTGKYHCSKKISQASAISSNY